MTERTVKTQGELDAAIAAGIDYVHINSPSGVWLSLYDNKSSRVEARESSRVEAWESSRVVAWESSHVVARGSSRVEAWESSRVEAWGSSQVVARGSSRVVAWESSHVVARGSSHVEARESSHVEARGSSQVVARGSSHVVAWGSSRVEARGSSRVEARESSQVVARGSSHVVAWGSSRVVAGKFVAVHLHSQRVTLSGGVVIDMTAIDKSDPQTWADMYGGKVSRGRLTVYKGVSAELKSAHGAAYPIGTTVKCDDWKATAECGNGLHFSPSPVSTESYCTPDRYLECTVKLSEIVPLGDKIKAASCRVVREVDRWGDPV